MTKLIAGAILALIGFLLILAVYQTCSPQRLFGAATPTSKDILLRSGNGRHSLSLRSTERGVSLTISNELGDTLTLASQETSRPRVEFSNGELLYVVFPDWPNLNLVTPPGRAIIQTQEAKNATQKEK